MAAPTNVAKPFYVGQNRLGGSLQPQIRRLPEKASQTFLQGVPVYIDGTGYIVIGVNSVSGSKYVGVGIEGGQNLTTNGTAKTLTLVQTPLNQPNAVIIPGGAPLNDGKQGVLVGTDDTLFVGVLANGSTGSVALAQTDIGAIYGLTQDAGNNFFYVDQNKATSANGAVVEVVDSLDAVGTTNARVLFRFLKAAQQLSQ